MAFLARKESGFCGIRSVLCGACLGIFHARRGVVVGELKTLAVAEHSTSVTQLTEFDVGTCEIGQPLGRVCEQTSRGFDYGWIDLAGIPTTLRPGERRCAHRQRAFCYSDGSMLVADVRHSIGAAQPSVL